MTDKAKSLLNGPLEIRLSRFKLLDGHMRAEAQAKFQIEKRIDDDCPQCRHCTHAIVESVQLSERDEIRVRAWCKIKSGRCVLADVAAYMPTPALDVWAGTAVAALSAADRAKFVTGEFVADRVSAFSAHGYGSVIDATTGEPIPFRRVSKDAPKTVAEEVW